MAERVKSDLKVEWDAERCPIVDGIIFGDGRVKRMGLDWVRNAAGRLELAVRPAGWTSLAELMEKGDLQWTGITPRCANIDAAMGLRLSCGEGGLGADGFVAVVQADRGEILWIAFFTQSNPFEVVQLAGDQVMAKTSLGTWWQFPLHSPESVTLL